MRHLAGAIPAGCMKSCLWWLALGAAVAACSRSDEAQKPSPASADIIVQCSPKNCSTGVVRAS